MSGETDPSGGMPQPASGPMDRETADWYLRHIDGQFQAFQGQDGEWYLYTPEPEPLDVQGAVPMDAAS